MLYSTAGTAGCAVLFRGLAKVYTCSDLRVHTAGDSNLCARAAVAAACLGSGIQLTF
jgi:hypothetical protein